MERSKASRARYGVGAARPTAMRGSMAARSSLIVMDATVRQKWISDKVQFDEF
jgi:hypothetical protein